MRLWAINLKTNLEQKTANNWVEKNSRKCNVQVKREKYFYIIIQLQISISVKYSQLNRYSSNQRIWRADQGKSPLFMLQPRINCDSANDLQKQDIDGHSDLSHRLGCQSATVQWMTIRTQFWKQRKFLPSALYCLWFQLANESHAKQKKL